MKEEERDAEKRSINLKQKRSHWNLKNNGNLLKCGRLSPLDFLFNFLYKKMFGSGKENLNCLTVGGGGGGGL